MKSLRSPLLGVGFVVLVIGGCNSILDNKPGTLNQSTDVAGNQPEDASTPPTSSSGGEVTVPPPEPPSAAGECDDGKFMCNGQCVSKDDPAFGCGAATCAPCALAHGTATCAAGACAVKVCDGGYADCNGKPEDGCEADLSKATSCGSCDAACPAATPVCAPSGETFQCGTGCTPAAPLLCGAECVDPMTSVNHCGGCGLQCPAVPNGEATCGLGQCGFTCHPDFHACNGRCAATTDATACGPLCQVCPTPPNTTPTCTADTCGFVCVAGFADCNAIAADGCEAPLASDPLNCGACGLSCNGGTCTNGVCAEAPDAAVLP